MRNSEQMSITLPKGMAELVRSKVASGEYASESEVIRDGLRSLAARDRALELWLRNEVVSAAAVSSPRPHDREPFSPAVPDKLSEIEARSVAAGAPATGGSSELASRDNAAKVLEFALLVT